jgi:hypothetical protein
MKKAVLFVCLLAVLNLTLVAQTGQNSRIVHTTERSTIHMPPQVVQAGLKTIYTNLGTKTNVYNDNAGEAILGPATGSTVFWAMPFIPKSDSHVLQARVAVQYNGSGANQVNLSIHGDSGGVEPGTLLAGPVTVTNLPEVGTCCILGVADFNQVAITGGTQYWVVADTPLTGTGSDFSGVWDFVFKPIYPQADNFGSGWAPFDGFAFKPAFAVLGTIP